MIRLSVKEQRVTLSVKDERPTLQVQGAVVVHTGGKPYEGPYEVTPKVEAQTLATKSKVMQDDVTVKHIPYFEMDNQNGTTVYIGSEV